MLSRWRSVNYSLSIEIRIYQERMQVNAGKNALMAVFSPPLRYLGSVVHQTRVNEPGRQYHEEHSSLDTASGHSNGGKRRDVGELVGVRDVSGAAGDGSDVPGGGERPERRQAGVSLRRARHRRGA